MDETNSEFSYLSKGEIISRLKEIYRSEEYIHLQQKLSLDTYLSSISKDNSETAFSSFICWMLNNEVFKNLPDSPTTNLLRILAHNAVMQNQESPKDVELMTGSMIDAIMSNSISIISSYAETEISTKKISTNDKTGKIDIIVYATIEVNSEIKKIRILLENKVYSAEHDNQCKTYYDFFSDKNKECNKPYDEDIYCFLAIDKNAKLSDGHFIKFNYQELLDSVLIPLAKYKEFLPQNLYFYITDFIDTLTTIKTDQKPQIAMTEEIRSLLKSFYDKNQDLIRAAILESDDEDVKSAIEKSTRKRNMTFEIIIAGQNKETIVGYPLLVYKTVSYLASKKSSTDIIDIFEGLGKIFGSKYLVSDQKDYYIDGKGTIRHLHKARREPIKCTDCKDIYCSGELTYDNIKSFIDFIKKKDLGVTIHPVGDF